MGTLQGKTATPLIINPKGRKRLLPVVTKSGYQEKRELWGKLAARS
jgi:hypothetical protein